MVHVVTKFAIEEEDVELLPAKKRTWWLKNVTSDSFVKGFPTIACTEKIDIELDLDDGEYILGCGDWNVVNAEDKHVSQRNYFSVDDGHIRYVKRMSELPSRSGATQTSWGGNGWGKKTEAEKPVVNEAQYVLCPMCVLCMKGTKKAVNSDDFDVMAQCCGDYNAEVPSESDSCMNCTNKVDLYIEAPKN